MAEVTTDHQQIREWIENRHGVPATVESTTSGKDDVGLLRVDFPAGSRDDALSTISWDDFFEKFEEKRLAFLHENKTAGGELSRFCKFVSRSS